MLPPEAIVRAIVADQWIAIAGRVQRSPVTCVTYEPSANAADIQTTSQRMRVVVPTPSAD